MRIAIAALPTQHKWVKLSSIHRIIQIQNFSQKLARLPCRGLICFFWLDDFPHMLLIVLYQQCLRVCTLQDIFGRIFDVWGFLSQGQTTLELEMLAHLKSVKLFFRHPVYNGPTIKMNPVRSEKIPKKQFLMQCASKRDLTIAINIPLQDTKNISQSTDGVNQLKQ